MSYFRSGRDDQQVINIEETFRADDFSGQNVLLDTDVLSRDSAFRRPNIQDRPHALPRIFKLLEEAGEGKSGTLFLVDFLV